jgi:hypothetical protein
MVTATISASGLVHMVGSSEVVVVGSGGPDSVQIGGFHPAGSVSDPTTPSFKQTMCQLMRAQVKCHKWLLGNDIRYLPRSRDGVLETG